MENIKTKSIKNIEEKLKDTDIDKLRHAVLQSAKSFKTSWIDFGQMLFTVWKDKLYKDWGYSTFEAYTSKEIGIRKQTAVKLLKSYYFLEREQPLYLKKEYHQQADAVSMPTYESVDLLRLASNRKEIEQADFARLKEDAFTKGKDIGQLKKDLTAMIRQRQQLEPQEARQKKKFALLRRLLSLLKSVRDEIEVSKMLPAQIIKETEKLINKIEAELSLK